MSKLVTVVVPVYNIEKYVKKCIESIIKQTYKNLEIILVNDGSKDNSLDICKEYKEKDQRIVIIDKPNGGLSDARNHAIKQATGEYIAFIDGDDFIKEDMIKDMLERIEETNSDICVCDMEYLYDNGSVSFASGGEFDTFTIKDSPELITINNSACNKLYKTSMFNDIQFPVEKYYEDLATIPVLLLKASRVCKVDKPFYVYYQRSGSIAHSANMKIFHIYEAIDNCIKYAQKYHSDNAVIEALRSLYVLHGLELTTLRIKDFDDKEIRTSYLKTNMEYLNKYYPTYKNDKRYKEYGLKKKIIFKLLEIGRYKAVLKIYDK